MSRMAGAARPAPLNARPGMRLPLCYYSLVHRWWRRLPVEGELLGLGHSEILHLTCVIHPGQAAPAVTREAFERLPSLGGFMSLDTCWKRRQLWSSSSVVYSLG